MVFSVSLRTTHTRLEGDAQTAIETTFNKHKAIVRYNDLDADIARDSSTLSHNRQFSYQFISTARVIFFPPASVGKSDSKRLQASHL